MSIGQFYRACLRMLGRSGLAAVLLLCACTARDDLRDENGAASTFTQSESSLEWPAATLSRTELLAWYNRRNETVMAVSASEADDFVAVAARLESPPVRMRIDFWSDGFSIDGAPTASTREEAGSVEIRPVYGGAMRGYNGDVLLATTTGESDDRNVLLFARAPGGRIIDIISGATGSADLSLAEGHQLRLCTDSAGLVAYSGANASERDWWYFSDGRLLVGERPQGCSLR